MWTITLRDLQYRWRQFAIAVVGAGLAFAMALVLTGMSAGFRAEARATVAAIGAGAWVLPRGVSGPFTTTTAIPVALLAGVSGGGQSEPIVAFGGVAHRPDGSIRVVRVIGDSIGALGDPVWGRGAVALPRGEVVVDERLGVGVGKTITIASSTLRVARVVEGQSAFGGQPIVFMSLPEAQAIAYGGRPIATAIVTRGTPTGLPASLHVVSNEAVRKDMLTPLEGAVSSIDLTRLLTWLLAAVVIGAVTYLSALERLRDFAVLKAVGASGRRLVLSLSAQAVLASLLAAVLGCAVAQLIKPSFPLVVSIETSAYVALPIVAIAVGILASLAAMRRAMGVDPALAFSG